MGTDRQQQVEERRRKTAETFERALDDPQFREQFLANAVPGGGQQAGQRSITLPPQVMEKRRQLLTAILDRASTDSQFRQVLTSDPRQALRSGGFSVQLEQLRAELPQDEVRGYGWEWTWTPWGWEVVLISNDGGSIAWT